MLDQKPFRNVIGIGGVARPWFRKSELDTYVGIDIEEILGCDKIYTEYYVQSCEAPWRPHLKADLVVSKYLLEHVPNNLKTFNNIKNVIIDGSVSVHILPLGWHPFSIANRVIGNKFAKLLIPIIRPGAERVTGYPAYYNICSSVGLEKMFVNIGVQYKIKYFYGVEDYFGFYAPFGCCVHIFNRIAHFFNLKLFASNAVVAILGSQDQ